MDYDVAIIGGGLVGMVAGLIMNRLNFSTIIFDDDLINYKKNFHSNQSSSNHVLEHKNNIQSNLASRVNDHVMVDIVELTNAKKVTDSRQLVLSLHSVNLLVSLGIDHNIFLPNNRIDKLNISCGGDIEEETNCLFKSCKRYLRAYLPSSKYQSILFDSLDYGLDYFGYAVSYTTLYYAILNCYCKLLSCDSCGITSKQKLNVDWSLFAINKIELFKQNASHIHLSNGLIHQNIKLILFAGGAFSSLNQLLYNNVDPIQNNTNIVQNDINLIQNHVINFDQTIKDKPINSLRSYNNIYNKYAVMFDVSMSNYIKHTVYERFNSTFGHIAIVPKAHIDETNSAFNLSDDLRSSHKVIFSVDSTIYHKNCQLKHDRAQYLLCYSQVFNKIFGNEFGRVQFIDHEHNLPEYELKLKIANYTHISNIILFGNALHTINPVFAQGLNLSIRDLISLYNYLLRSKSNTSSKQERFKHTYKNNIADCELDINHQTSANNMIIDHFFATYFNAYINNKINDINHTVELTNFIATIKYPTSQTIMSISKLIPNYIRSLFIKRFIFG